MNGSVEAVAMEETINLAPTNTSINSSAILDDNAAGDSINSLLFKSKDLCNSTNRVADPTNGTPGSMSSIPTRDSTKCTNGKESTGRYSSSAIEEFATQVSGEIMRESIVKACKKLTKQSKNEKSKDN